MKVQVGDLILCKKYKHVGYIIKARPDIDFYLIQWDDFAYAVAESLTSLNRLLDRPDYKLIACKSSK